MWTDLATALEASAGEDWRLNHRIRDLLGGHDYPGIPPNWTGSVDCILHLIGEKLPGWRGQVEFSTPSFARVWNPAEPVLSASSHGACATPALALTAAFARARQTEERRDG